MLSELHHLSSPSVQEEVCRDEKTERSEIHPIHAIATSERPFLKKDRIMLDLCRSLQEIDVTMFSGRDSGLTTLMMDRIGHGVWSTVSHCIPRP